MVRIFPTKNWGGFIDNFKKGTCEGFPIYQLQQKQVDKSATVLISNYDDASIMKIKDTLLNNGYENIVELKLFYKAAAENMYFDSTCLKMEWKQEDIFVDAGVYDGDDERRLFSKFMKKDIRVLAFEPDPINFTVCHKNLSKVNSIRLYPYGLGKKSETLRFYGNGKDNSAYNPEGNIDVQVVALDKYFHEGNIGFIKMDIEGMEADALIGAKRILIEMKPILAISIYHKRNDIWELPNLIMSMQSDYRFYLRHYSVGVTDTVLYAIPQNYKQKEV